MRTINIRIFLVFILLVSLTLAFSPAFEDTSPNTIVDDFEGYSSERHFDRVWQAWKEGSQVELTRLPSEIDDHGYVMQVEVKGLGEGEQPNIGSVYALLGTGNRDWSGGATMSFWINNLSGDDLFISINFKERYNEFWATEHNGIVFLQPEEGILQQSVIQYGNINIPPDFTGSVIIPFTSFALPEWNTANGDGVLELSSMESLGFAVMAQDKLPFTFQMDDFEVLGTVYGDFLSITGLDYIYLPESGSHVEDYSLSLVSLVGEETQEVPAAQWRVVSPIDAGVSISEDGQLSITHDIEASEILLSASYDTALGTLSTQYAIKLGRSADSGEMELSVPAEKPPDEMDSAQPETELQKISKQYNSWLENYRLVTVIASVLVVLLIVFVFSYIDIRVR